MTFIFKTEKVNGYTIELQQGKFEDSYRVCVYKGEKTIEERPYATKEQAMRRFRDMRKQVKEWR